MEGQGLWKGIAREAPPGAPLAISVQVFGRRGVSALRKGKALWKGHCSRGASACGGASRLSGSTTLAGVADPLPLRGILFDFDGTVGDSWGGYDRQRQAISDVVRRRAPGVDVDEFERRYVALSDSHYAVMLRENHAYDEFRRRRLAEALEPWHVLDDDLFGEYLVAHNRAIDELPAFPDAVATIRALRARGIRVGVLTNGPSALQRRKLRASGLADEFDAIAVSGELGFHKPDRRAFEKALALLGTCAEETAMVGDDLENDVAGALAAGFAAVVWVERAPGALPAGARLVREIAEVPRILGLD
jgi:putative hydrolase of the HAD superfamily